MNAEWTPLDIAFARLYHHVGMIATRRHAE